MKKKKTFTALCCLFALIICSCNNDDDLEMPADAITLNMMNEGNGKTVLGESDLYINAANNFYTSRCGITEANSGSYSKRSPRTVFMPSLPAHTLSGRTKCSTTSAWRTSSRTATR